MKKVRLPVVGAIDRCEFSCPERLYVDNIIATWTRKSIRCVRFPKTKAGLGCVLSVREMSYFSRSDTVQLSFTRLAQVISVKSIGIWLESVDSSGYLCTNIIRALLATWLNSSQKEWRCGPLNYSLQKSLNRSEQI